MMLFAVRVSRNSAGWCMFVIGICSTIWCTTYWVRGQLPWKEYRYWLLGSLAFTLVGAFGIVDWSHPEF